jgi:hypothetical protein
MNHAQQELVSVLLESVYEQKLISKSTYFRANDLVHCVIDLPDLFVYPVCLEKGGRQHEYTQDTQ